MTIQNSTITDGWTRSEGYAKALQSPEQINDVLGILALDSAQALADIGCGNGAFAVPAALGYPRCQVFACDSLEAAITELRRCLVRPPGPHGPPNKPRPRLGSGQVRSLNGREN